MRRDRLRAQSRGRCATASSRQGRLQAPRAGAAGPSGERVDLVKLQQGRLRQNATRKDAALRRRRRRSSSSARSSIIVKRHKKLAVAEAVQRKSQELAEGEKRILTLENELTAQQAASRLKEKSLQEQYERKSPQARTSRSSITSDCGARQSTKMTARAWAALHDAVQRPTLRMTAFRRRTLKRTTTRARAARATLFSANRTRAARSSSPSCSR